MKRKKERDNRPLPNSLDSPEGARLALTNARRHLRIADVLSDERLFGSASTHAVLALEELAKSWMLTLIAMGIDVPRNLISDVLRNHFIRHVMVFGLLFVGMIHGLRHRAEIRVQKRHRIKDCPPELRDEFVEELRVEFKLFSSRSRKRNPLLLLLELTGGANDLKNQGLYVDFDGKKWSHPGRVSQQRFALSYEVTKSLVHTLGRIITMIQRTGFKVDEEAKAVIANLVADNKDVSPDKFLKNLTEFALRTPI